MTESEIPRAPLTPIVVLKVHDGNPPFRLVEVEGEPVGMAFSLMDVMGHVHRLGLKASDLDDPDKVRWVGGDKYTWRARPWR